MKPKLNEQEKAALIYDLMVWAVTNEGVRNADTPKRDIFYLIEVIQDDSKPPKPASNGELLIKELRKDEIMWQKIRPFLQNIGATCKTRIIHHSYDGTLVNGPCGHLREEHVDGKCLGTHGYRRMKPGAPLDARYYHSEWTEYIKAPCSCTCHKTTQTW